MVATNSWMNGLVRESPLLRGFDCSVIPNGVATEIYQPLPKVKARELLGINRNSHVVLFAAHVVAPDTRKGGEFVAPVMEKVASSGFNNLVLLVLGEKAESWKEGHGYQTVRLGFTQSEPLLAIVYSAADVLLSPSVAENFPNTVVESFACGTPAVGFDTGGMADVIRHMETGYLARYRELDDLVNGLRLLVKDKGLRLTIGRRCREVAENEYSLKLQAARFKALYERILGNHGTLS